MFYEQGALHSPSFMTTIMETSFLFTFSFGVANTPATLKHLQMPELIPELNHCSAAPQHQARNAQHT